MDKVTIETLPDTKDIVGPKRWTEERGEFVQISYRENIGHLALFEIKKGFSRGGHYHDKKEEIFYIFNGTLRATFLDIDTGQKEEQLLREGDRIRIKPLCGHLFLGLEDSLMVEYSPQFFNSEDSYRVNL